MTAIQITREGPLAIVTLNRPEKRNALAMPHWQALGAAIRGFAGDEGVRAVVLTGAGGHFCAGADIGEFDSTRRDARSGEAYTRAVDASAEAILELAKPVIGAIEGSCFGGGCGLAMDCDIRIAAKGARFAVPAAKLNIVYNLRDTRNLLSLAGPGHAKRILFTGEPVDAETALRLGLVDELSEAPLESAKRLALKIAENAPMSVAGAKTLLNALIAGRPAEKLAEQLSLRALESDDYKEGRRAFKEKRKPKFTGR
ncbi:MAG: enoyl-CoA hydratase/isomerase family protein [Candidatus Odyssella sp.]|nr:enoyl-CoA hydratase/isomerase family protein [Candidatus Odyssella sp.]